MRATDPQRANRKGRARDAEPMRTCIGCRLSRPQSELLRFRRRPDGEVVPVTGTWPQHRGSPGRTAYVCPSRRCYEQAHVRRGWTRALAGRRGLSVRPEGLKLWPAMATQIVNGLDQHAERLTRTRASSTPRTLHVTDRLRAQLRAELGVRGKDA